MQTIIKAALTVVAAGILTAFAVFEQANRSIDPNYTMKFSTGLASGTFSGLKGTVLFSPEDPSGSKINVTVDAASINTGNTTKDTHAKGEDWLNTAKFPLIKFSSTAITKQGEHYTIEGNMELHGVSKSVKILANYADKNSKGVFSGTFAINRDDYGVGTGLKAKMVGSDIKITFNIPTTKQ